MSQDPRPSWIKDINLNLFSPGSNNGITWKSLATQHEVICLRYFERHYLAKLAMNINTIWFQFQADGRFKVDHDKTWTSVAFQQYKLRIIASSWSKSGATHGTITIGDVQLCLLDDFGTYNDNHLVTSPPFIAFGRPFATSRFDWGTSAATND